MVHPGPPGVGGAAGAATTGAEPPDQPPGPQGEALKVRPRIQCGVNLGPQFWPGILD